MTLKNKSFYIKFIVPLEEIILIEVNFSYFTGIKTYLSDKANILNMVIWGALRIISKNIMNYSID